MKASRETARTSRAAAPSAAPAAPQRRPADEDREQPEPEPAPVQRHEYLQPGEHQQGDDEADRDPEHDLLGEQGGGGDQAPGQPREGVLLALERQRPGDQEDGDEGEGEGRGDGDREDVERRRGAVDHLLLDLDRLRQAVDQRLARRRGFRGPGTEKRITRSSESRWAPGGTVGRSASRIAPVVFSPRISIEVPSTSNSPPSISRLRYLPPSVGDPLGDHQVGLGEQGADPVVDRLRLERVLLVDEDFDLRRAGRERRERVDLVDQVGGQDQRRQRVAGFDLLYRFGAILRPGRTRPARRSGR